MFHIGKLNNFIQKDQFELFNKITYKIYTLKYREYEIIYYIVSYCDLYNIVKNKIL